VVSPSKDSYIRNWFSEPTATDSSQGAIENSAHRRIRETNLGENLVKLIDSLL
jgi:hypothetical protein